MRYRLGPMALTALAAAGLLAVSGCAAWKLNRAIVVAGDSQALQQTPGEPSLRLLIVGDSTAVGTGASAAIHSLAGLVARGHPRLLIENRGRNGARFADVADQLIGEQRFDIVIVQAGGNDVIRLTGRDTLQADIDRVADRAKALAGVVVLMPAGNVGNAPFFFAPLSWWMTTRARTMHALVQDAAARTGAVYVNLFHERADDPFVKDRGLHARDGLHPSDAGYLAWFNELQVQAALADRLQGARAAGV